MGTETQGGLRIALLAGDEQRAPFRDLLEGAGFRVVVEQSLEAELPDSWGEAEVVLASGDGDRERIEALLERSPLPVLFNQGGPGGRCWSKGLADKLRLLASRGAGRADAGHGRARGGSGPAAIERRRHETPWLVVLGASIGGPKAVARFLRALPDDLPVAFLLAQHMSASFQDLLVEQLDRCSRWTVAVPGERQRLAAGQVWLVPAENRIEVRRGGEIRRSAGRWRSVQRPDINAVLGNAASVFGARCGAIMFSGLGSDGVQACDLVARHGGFMWAQSSESCVISNMPEAVRRGCKVEFSGTPEELAQALGRRCRGELPRIN